MYARHLSNEVRCPQPDMDRLPSALGSFCRGCARCRCIIHLESEAVGIGAIQCFSHRLWRVVIGFDYDIREAFRLVYLEANGQRPAFFVDQVEDLQSHFGQIPQ